MNISGKITGRKISICETSNLMTGDQLGDTDLTGRIILKFILKTMWFEIPHQEV
jgi:hypothetical protein